MSTTTGTGRPAWRRAASLLLVPLRVLRRPAVLLPLILGPPLAALVVIGWCLLRLPVDGGMTAEANAGGSLLFEDASGEAFAARGALRGEPIRADRLPQPLTDAVMAIEDRRFRDHGGIDLRGIARAGWRNLAGGRRPEGGSTITQQLARLQYLSLERSFTRKAQEVLIALWLERQLSKDEILARYLGRAYFGAGAWGADAAARRYFDKGAGELSLPEAAMLAGLVRAPSQLAPTRNPQGAWRRAELVLAAMVESGRISQDAADAARRAAPALRMPPEMDVARGWFVDWAEGEARRLLGPMPVDLAARTTLDPELQKVAERVVATRLEQDGAQVNAGQAALVAMRYGGAVLAAVGGRDYATSQFNRITQARRQSGSLFKLFVYGAAIEAGYVPDTLVIDQPVRIGAWEPQNFGGGFRGPTTVRQAFAQSINSVAVQLSEGVGRERVVEMARRLGLRSDLPPVPSVALGVAETTLLEMTGAFASVAAGRRVEPHVIRSLRTRDRGIYARPETAEAGETLSPVLQRHLLDLLLSAVRDGTGRAARLERPVAGKTGTTQDHRDAWFIAFNADVVVGVWVGNDDNAPMSGVTGGDLPARIWRDFVAEADRLKGSRARATVPQPAQAASPAPSLPPLRGRALVLDTGTLVLGDQEVRLAGVIGFSGDHAHEMALYLEGREVSCEAAPVQPGFHRCRAGGRDLAQVVIFNGGGRASADAEPALHAAETQARQSRLGIWAR